MPLRRMRTSQYIQLFVSLGLIIFSVNASWAQYATELVNPYLVERDSARILKIDTLKSKTMIPQERSKNLFLRALQDAFVKPPPPAVQNTIVESENQYYERFSGRTIERIVFVRGDVLLNAEKWVERAINNAHINTRESQIRQDLLFGVGDTINPALMITNRQLIDSRDYITNVTMVIKPNPSDTTQIDLYVITQDRWTLSVDLQWRGSGNSYVKLYDDNFLGFGDHLGVSTYFDPTDGMKYQGNMVNFSTDNFVGSFFDIDATVGKAADQHRVDVVAQRDFIKMKDYMGGVDFSNAREYLYYFPDDSTILTTHTTVELWGGYSWPIARWNNSLYVTGLVQHKNFTERPEVSATFNPYFHNDDLYMLQTGLYRERFRITDRIYGYGSSEYIPYGYRMSVQGGYSVGEFGNRLYGALEGTYAKFTPIGYFAVVGALGSYLNESDHQLYTSTATLRMEYFSNLLGKGSYATRLFFGLGATRGWNRLDGYNERVTFNSTNELRGFSETVYGVNRLVFNSEAVIFTPWNFYQFKCTLFSYGDFGLLGDNGNYFKNPLYTTFGVGLRIKNEHLVFKTIEVRLGVSLGKTGLYPGNYFYINNGGEEVGDYRIIPTKPVEVPYQ